MNKYVWAVLSLILGFFLGAAFQRMAGSKSTGTEELNKINSLESRVLGLEQENATLKGQSQSLSSENEQCQSRFKRSTILYDGVLFTDRRWIIPADVEPIQLGNRPGASFSHYDPSTQIETVKFKPKVQQ